MGIDYIEMDALFWRENWQSQPDDIFLNEIDIALRKESWILDGNYSRTTELKWREVNTVIWLDYSFIRAFYQSARRAIYRAYKKEELWRDTGNVETFRKLFSRNSIILWSIKNYYKNRKRYTEIMKDEKYSHIEFVHLRCPESADNYIESNSC